MICSTAASNIPSIIDLPYVDEFLSSSSRNLLGIFLRMQGFYRSFDHVHRVSRTGDSSSKVVYAGAFGDFPDILGATKAKTYDQE